MIREQAGYGLCFSIFLIIKTCLFRIRLIFLSKKPHMKILTTPRMERCIGCHSCSLACARLVHKRLSWDTAGIRISSSGGLSTGFESRICLACDPAPCTLVCPTGAFSQRKGGGVLVRKKLCIRCGECNIACPVDAIYSDMTGEPFVCIHCGRCVPFCPHDCLEMVKILSEENEEEESGL